MFRTSFGIQMLHRARRRARRLKAAARKRLLQERQRARLEEVTESNAARSPLLRLPAEIRNLVYHYVFCDKGFILDDYKWINKRRTTLRSYDSKGIALLRVCRQLHQETALVPYKLATFNFGVDHWDGMRSKTNAIATFLELSSMAQIRALSRLEYHKSFYAWRKNDVETGTGLYWADYLGCMNFVSFLNTHGGQIA